MRAKVGIAVCVAILMLAATVLAQDKAKPPKPKRETFSALAYLPTGAGIRMAGAGSTANVTINLERYSSEEEAADLRQTLMSQGSDAVLKKLQKMKSKGKISMVGRVGLYDFKFVRSFPTPTGRRIIAVADRPIGFLEAYYSNRSMDYTFGILQLDLKMNEKEKEEGEGALIFAAKVKVIDPKNVEIENYGIDPVKLMGVRKF